MKNVQSCKPVRTTCAYCGVGCGIVAEPQADGTVAISGDPDHPSNFGRLCSKGSALGETLSMEGRLVHPEIRGERASWDAALDLVASKFRETIDNYGPDSVAFYVSGQFLTEDYYVANKLAKGFIGTANIDTNSRLCMASSVAGQKRAFGSDTVPVTYEDLELADLVVVVGSNLAWCHPVLFQRIMAAREKRTGMQIVVVDPRRTATADLADMHLAIAPDSDVALFNGLLAHLCGTAQTDKAYIETHTKGFAEALTAAAEASLAETSDATGLSTAQLRAFYELFSRTKKTVTVYSQGVNQSRTGTDKVNAIINCHLATGRIGKPGTGPFSVTGQPNAMGGREVGGLANTLAAHMEIENPAHRDLVSLFWNSRSLPAGPGLKALDMFQAIGDGRIKAVWIMATNPAVSMPGVQSIDRALGKCPFVVVSDVVAETDTLRHAHVKLPSTAWGEKDGTVTNSERRISRQRAFLSAPGEAMPDWWQLAEVAKRMGFAEAFDYAGPAEIFAEHARLSGFGNSGSRDFDISAYNEIGAAEYHVLNPFQWPKPKGGENAGARFFSSGRYYTSDAKARFVPVKSDITMGEIVSRSLVLNTGRVRDHWHTMTRTGKSERLSAHIGEPFGELHPADAKALGIGDADLIRLENSQGHMLVRALITNRQRPGSIFVPMHWNGQFASCGRAGALVASIADPISGQPAAKNNTVSVSRFKAGCYGFMVSAREPKPQGLDYWALARCKGGWRLEFACADRMVGKQDLACALLGAALGNEDMLSYRDAERGDFRGAVFTGGKLYGAVFMADLPVQVSRSWAAALLAADHSDKRSRFRVIAGKPGCGRPDAGAIVCSCYSVGANEIARTVRSGCKSVEEIGRSLSAGTNCGSCRAEIQGIIREHQIIAAE